jgi:hypothetical protein
MIRVLKEAEDQALQESRRSKRKANGASKDAFLRVVKKTLK